MGRPPLPHVLVIGMGEVGNRLARALARADVACSEVTRRRGWDRATAATNDLRLVCVREEELAPVLQRLAPVPAERLVLVQNGWIRPLLEERRQATRGLLWFTSKGDFFRVLRPSPFGGPWAAALAAALTAGGIAATAVEEDALTALEAEKMGFNCVVGLPLAVHRITLGDYLEHHGLEAHELFTESVTACALALGTRAQAGWWQAFLRAAEPLGWMRSTSAKALSFRNRAVADLAAAAGLEVPVTRRLLAAWSDRPESATRRTSDKD